MSMCTFEKNSVALKEKNKGYSEHDGVA